MALQLFSRPAVSIACALILGMLLIQVFELSIMAPIAFGCLLLFFLLGIFFRKQFLLCFFLALIFFVGYGLMFQSLHPKISSHSVYYQTPSPEVVSLLGTVSRFEKRK